MLTAANDGLVTRILLGSSAPTSESRNCTYLCRHAHDVAGDSLQRLSLPLTHPDAGAPESARRADVDEAEGVPLFFPFGRRRACFEAKFVDTAGQLAAAALEIGFVALFDFR